MNMLNKVISKASLSRNKKLIEALPKSFAINAISKKNFFVSQNNFNSNNEIDNMRNISLSSLNKIIKYNMTSSINFSQY